jgi:hypothetical protein
MQHLTVCQDATCFISHSWVVPTRHHNADDLNDHGPHSTSILGSLDGHGQSEELLNVDVSIATFCRMKKYHAGARDVDNACVRCGRQARCTTSEFGLIESMFTSIIGFLSLGALCADADACVPSFLTCIVGSYSPFGIPTMSLLVGSLLPLLTGRRVIQILLK